jgi:hypothetical protein
VAARVVVAGSGFEMMAEQAGPHVQEPACPPRASHGPEIIQMQALESSSEEPLMCDESELEEPRQTASPSFGNSPNPTYYILAGWHELVVSEPREGGRRRPIAAVGRDGYRGSLEAMVAYGRHLLEEGGIATPGALDELARVLFVLGQLAVQWPASPDEDAPRPFADMAGGPTLAQAQLFVSSARTLETAVGRLARERMELELQLDALGPLTLRDVSVPALPERSFVAPDIRAASPIASLQTDRQVIVDYLGAVHLRLEELGFGTESPRREVASHAALLRELLSDTWLSPERVTTYMEARHRALGAVRTIADEPFLARYGGPRDEDELSPEEREDLRRAFHRNGGHLRATFHVAAGDVRRARQGGADIAADLVQAGMCVAITLVAPQLGAAVASLLAAREALARSVESVAKVVIEKFGEQAIAAVRGTSEVATRGSLASRLADMEWLYSLALRSQGEYIDTHEGNREALPDVELAALVANAKVLGDDRGHFVRAIGAEVDRWEEQIDPIGRVSRLHGTHFYESGTFAARVDLTGHGLRSRVALIEAESTGLPHQLTLRGWVDRDLEDAALAANRPVHRDLVKTYTPHELRGFSVPEDQSYARRGLP